MAARVVDLPLPVGPVTKISPFRNKLNLAYISGNPINERGATSVAITRKVKLSEFL